jgi:hypothetical protein
MSDLDTETELSYDNKNELNIFVKDIENKLDELNNNELSEHLIENTISNNEIVKNNTNNVDILIYTLLFILLNNEYIINIFNKISNYNLLIRSILFGLIIYLIKKCY